MMQNIYLVHSAKGTTWKKHKYIRITPSGRYIYEGETVAKKEQLRRKEEEQRTKVKNEFQESIRKFHKEGIDPGKWEAKLRAEALSRVMKQKHSTHDPDEVRVKSSNGKALEKTGWERIESLIKVGSLKKDFKEARKKR